MAVKIGWEGDGVPMKKENQMKMREMLKGFVVATIMVAVGVVIVIANDGPKSLVSSVGTALATLGIDRALRTWARRKAMGEVTSIGSVSVEGENAKFYMK